MPTFGATVGKPKVNYIDSVDDGRIDSCDPVAVLSFTAESGNPHELADRLAAMRGKRVRVQVTDTEGDLFEPRAEVAILLVEQAGIIIDVQAFASRVAADAQAEREMAAAPEGAERRVFVWGQIPIYDGRPKAAEGEAGTEGADPELPMGDDGDGAEDPLDEIERAGENGLDAEDLGVTVTPDEAMAALDAAHDSPGHDGAEGVDGEPEA